MKWWIFVIVFPNLLFSQTSVNQDSLIYYFKDIINSYRKSRGLQLIEIDTSMKVLSDNWSKNMSLRNQVDHGQGENHFQKRIIDCNCLPLGIQVFENCTELLTPKTPTDLIVTFSNGQISSLMNKSLRGTISQKEYALYGFLLWKSSPPHNQTMLNPDMRYFYLSSAFGFEKTFISFIGRTVNSTDN